jgi:hypothetical protein
VSGDAGMRRTAALVLLTQAVVLAALWLVGRWFSS